MRNIIILAAMILFPSFGSSQTSISALADNACVSIGDWSIHVSNLYYNGNTIQDIQQIITQLQGPEHIKQHMLFVATDVWNAGYNAQIRNEQQLLDFQSNAWTYWYDRCLASKGEAL